MTPAGALLDRFLLALCVWREARGETLTGKQLVAATVMNRVQDTLHRWPGTISGVILQPMQFSSFNAADPNAVKFPSSLSGMADWNDCVQAADEAIAGPLITTANHYHVEGLLPAWRDPTKIVAVEGAHVFYKL
jgi:spore germination cell wall hydrolase CwlJ-like protein